MTLARGNIARNAATAGACSRRSPPLATITGSSTTGQARPEMPSATVSMMGASPSMPILIASILISSRIAAIWAATISLSHRLTAVTPRVFWAVSAVRTLIA